MTFETWLTEKIENSAQAAREAAGPCPMSWFSFGYLSALRDAQAAFVEKPSGVSAERQMRSVLRGVEIALARDGDVDGAMSIITRAGLSP